MGGGTTWERVPEIMQRADSGIAGSDCGNLGKLWNKIMSYEIIELQISYC